MASLPKRIPRRRQPSPDDASRQITNLKQEIEWIRSLLPHQDPIAGYLARRGLLCKRLNPTEHLLLPKAPDRTGQDRFYDCLKKYSFRLFLRDVIKNKTRFGLKDLLRYCSAETAASYLEVLQEYQVITDLGNQTFQLALDEVYSFGDTLEWFVAQVLAREFYTPSSWGLSLQGTAHGGDYDVLALAENKTIYVEVKSSPPKQVESGEISAFLDRIGDLDPDLGIFLEDTQLRMEDKILPMFADVLSTKPHLTAGTPEPVRLPGGDVFQWGDRLFIMNAEPDLVGNMGLCLQHFFGPKVR
ncbi:MAG: hypothetical protein HYY65_02135 [Candidatus Tectomicrobia bacterium]|uniref:Uncharacterized protein n=1 Tax=Tectimicrobiota bacterium TaxID=2528274 RepID=A0A932GMP4_UNCTE|nr:hypothetical protein [Candidatus Tectomicrobia bacterium]